MTSAKCTRNLNPFPLPMSSAGNLSEVFPLLVQTSFMDRPLLFLPSPPSVLFSPPPDLRLKARTRPVSSPSRGGFPTID